MKVTASSHTYRLISFNNAYNTVLSTGLYTEPRKMWRKKLSYDKTWAGFRKFFAEEYNNPRELQHINATQTGFHGANMAITMQYEIVEALENLAIATTS